MIAVIIALVAAVNPAAAAAALATDRRANRPAPVAVGAAVAFAVLAVLALAGDTIIDLLDVNLGTYQLGAGTAVALCGLRWLVAGPAATAEEPESDRGLAGFVAFPALLTPAAVALVVSASADDGAGAAIVGVIVAVALGAAGIYNRRSIPRAVIIGFVRLLGAIAVIVGVALAVNGVRTL